MIGGKGGFSGMNADELSIMEEALNKAVSFINDTTVEWSAKSCVGLNDGVRCKDAVEYTAKKDLCQMVVISGTSLEDGNVFYEGAVTFLDPGAPSVMRLPPEMAKDAVQAALKNIMDRNTT